MAIASLRASPLSSLDDDHMLPLELDSVSLNILLRDGENNMEKEGVCSWIEIERRVRNV
jgi:hypothetical protein